MAESSLRSKAARGFLWGGLNNGLVQLIGALFGIIVLRLLSPAEYGKVYMLMVFPTLASILQESGFTAALCNLKAPTPRDYNAVFWFNTGMGALLYLLLFCLAPVIANFYADPSLLWLSRYLFLGFLISSFGTVQRAYLYIHLMNRESCIIAVVSLLASNVVGLTMVVMGYSYWGLATQHILFVLIVAIMNWCYSPWRPSFKIDLRPAWRMFGFSSKLLFTSLCNTLASQAFAFLLGRFYGSTTAGIFGNARKWNDMAANTINGMVSGVAQPILSRMVDEEARYRNAFRKMLRFVSFVCFPAMLGVGLIAREFLLLVVGSKWEASARLLSLVVIYGTTVPLATLYSQMSISRGKSQMNMICTVSLSLLVLIGLWALHPFGLDAMVIYFVAINVAWLVVWQCVARRLIGLRFRHAAVDTLPFLFLAAAAMGIAWWAASGLDSLVASLVVKIAVAATAYLGSLYLLRAKILRESFNYIFHKHSS